MHLPVRGIVVLEQIEGSLRHTFQLHISLYGVKLIVTYEMVWKLAQ